MQWNSWKAASRKVESVATGLAPAAFKQPLNQTPSICGRFFCWPKKISSSHHFKVIQFPFNFVERQAALKPEESAGSVIEFARENGLFTFGNRPLNAIAAKGILRLATQEVILPAESEIQDQWERCRRLLDKQMASRGEANAPGSLEIIQLFDAWKELQNTESVDLVFHQYFYPLLRRLYEGSIPEDEAVTYTKFHSFLVASAKHRMNQAAMEMRDQLIAGGLVREDDKSTPGRNCMPDLSGGGFGLRSGRHAECPLRR